MSALQGPSFGGSHVTVATTMVWRSDVIDTPRDGTPLLALAADGVPEVVAWRDGLGGCWANANGFTVHPLVWAFIPRPDGRGHLGPEASPL